MLRLSFFSDQSCAAVRALLNFVDDTFVFGDKKLRDKFYAHCKKSFNINYVGVPEKLLGMELAYKMEKGKLVAELTGQRVAQKLIKDQTLLPEELDTHNDI